MNKSALVIIPVLLLLGTQLASAQYLKEEDNVTTTCSELRVEAEFTKHFKVKGQGLNLYFGEAVFSRLYESTYSQSAAAATNVPAYFRRSYTTVGLNYTPIPYLRIGADYTLKIIGNKITATDGTTVTRNPADEWIRHRAAFYLTGYYTYQDWKFSLREKLDVNIRTDSVNLHEKPKVVLALRHKLQAQYSIPGKPLKTSAFVEVWNTLNQPVKYLNTYAVRDKEGNATAYAGKSFGQYVSEVRAQIGIDWRIDRCNTLGLAYRYVYGYSRNVNITKTKTENGEQKGGNIELTHVRSHGHFIVLTYNLDW